MSSNDGNNTLYLLIDLVASHPHLYDMKSRHYKDATMKENTWEEIGIVLERSSADCKRLWKNLRDRFTREKRTKSGDPAKESEWPYFNQMQFYGKHCTPRKTVTNTPSCSTTVVMDDDSQDTSSSSSYRESLMSPQAETSWNSLEMEVPEEERLEAQQTPSSKSKRKRSAPLKEIDDIITVARQITQQMSTPSSVNECFGKYVAAQLNEMDVDKAKQARRQISAILE